MRAVLSNSLPPYELVGSAPKRRVPTELVALRLHGGARPGLLERIPLVEGVDDAARELGWKVARACAGVQPCVPRLVDIEAAPNALHVLWSMTDAVPFTDVRAALREHECPLELRLRIAIDLLTAIDLLCKAQRAWLEPTACVHGEITPDTLMVGANGVTRLTGLPTARRARSAIDAPCHDAFVAPELADASIAPTTRSDIFSTGAILCELLTLRPFETHAQPVTPERAAWATGVASLARRCLSPRPAMRPSDVGIILSELRGALGSRLASTGALAEWMTAKFADRIREQQEAWKARGASLAPANRFPSVRPARASAPPLLGGGAPAAPLDEADVAAIREFFSVSSPPPPFAAESPTNPTASTLPRAAFPSVPPPSVGVLGPQGTPSPSDAAIQVEVDDGRRDELTSPGLRAVSRQKRRRVIVAVITAACACLATVAAGVAVRAPSRPNVPPPRHAAPVLSVPPSSDTTATPAAAPDATQLAQPADSETAAPTPLPTVATPLTNPALPQLSPRPPPTAGGTGKTAPAQPAATSAATPGKAQGKNNYDPLGI